MMLVVDFFPWKKLWWKVVSSKVSAFSWKAIRERIPSKENLMKRGLSVVNDSVICSSYLGAVESSNQLSFTCSSVIVVRGEILQWLG